MVTPSTSPAVVVPPTPCAGRAPAGLWPSFAAIAVSSTVMPAPESSRMSEGTPSTRPFM